MKAVEINQGDVSVIAFSEESKIARGMIVRFLEHDVVVVRVPIPTNIVVARATWWRRILARAGYYKWRWRADDRRR